MRRTLRSNAQKNLERATRRSLWNALGVATGNTLATPEAIGLDENSGTSDAKTFGTLVGGVFDVAVQSPYKRSHRGSDVLVLQMSRLVGGLYGFREDTPPQRHGGNGVFDLAARKKIPS